jgi:hypothetical protein
MVDFVAVSRLLPARLQSVLRDGCAQTFSAPMLAAEFEGLAELAGEDGDFMLFFEPPSLHPRMVNQFALFSLMSRPQTRVEPWLAERATDRPGLARRLVIPAARKWEIRDKLDAMNVTERVLTPGLDGLSAWLARWYTAKPRARVS